MVAVSTACLVSIKASVICSSLFLSIVITLPLAILSKAASFALSEVIKYTKVFSIFNKFTNSLLLVDFNNTFSLLLIYSLILVNSFCYLPATIINICEIKLHFLFNVKFSIFIFLK